MLMNKVAVILEQDYSKCEYIYVGGDLSPEDIVKEINKKFKVWYYYDLITPKHQ